MIEELEKYDQDLFLRLNGMHQDWLDPIMIGLSEPIYSVPVIALALYVVKLKFGWRTTLYSLFGLALVITLCDGISDKIFKDGFQRWRPCKHLIIGPQTYLPKPCPGGWYSFVSGHATSFFGMATFYARLLKTSELDGDCLNDMGIIGSLQQNLFRCSLSGRCYWRSFTWNVLGLVGIQIFYQSCYKF